MSSPATVAVCPRSLCGYEPFRSALLARYPSARFNESGHRLAGEELVDFLQGVERVVVGVERIGAEALRRLPSLKVVVKFGVGLDNLDFDALEAACVEVGWTPGVNRRAVAELTLAGTLALLRGLPDGDRQIRSGALRAGPFRPPVGRQLSEQRVGVVGCGHVGLETVKLMRALGAQVSACDIRDRREWLDPLGVPQISLEQLCGSSDVVALHASLSVESHGLLGPREIALLKPGAIVVNTARGELIDEAVLLEALESGKLHGAFLDVLRDEPAAPGPLVSHPRVLVSAHVGWSTEHALDTMARAVLSNLSQPLPLPELRTRLEAGRIEDP